MINFKMFKKLGINLKNWEKKNVFGDKIEIIRYKKLKNN